MLNIDHLLWAVPDLDEGIAFFEGLTGVRAARGGSHPGRGTRNALASFGDGRYLELLAPDPAQDLDALAGTGWSSTLRAMPAPALFTFAVGCTDMAALKKAAADVGIVFDGPNEASRLQPDGSTLRWTLGHADDTGFGRCAPFYIDWLDSAHPSTVVPGGLELLEFEVLHPHADRLEGLFKALSIGVPVRRADRPGMRALIRSATGETVLSSQG